MQIALRLIKECNLEGSVQPERLYPPSLLITPHHLLYIIDLLQDAQYLRFTSSTACHNPDR